MIQGQVKAVGYRYVVETIMQTDPILDEIFEPYQYEERAEFFEGAVKKEVDRRKEDFDPDGGGGF